MVGDCHNYIFSGDKFQDFNICNNPFYTETFEDVDSSFLQTRACLTDTTRLSGRRWTHPAISHSESREPERLSEIRTASRRWRDVTSTSRWSCRRQQTYRNDVKPQTSTCMTWVSILIVYRMCSGIIILTKREVAMKCRVRDLEKFYPYYYNTFEY